MTANNAALSQAIASVPDVGAPPVPALEVWYVATRSGTHALTLDELHEALERGEVDSATQLWIPGMAEWEALGTLANLEDGPPLERRPGAMLEYGLDAERATHAEDGSVLPGAGDIRDYDPFSLPPPTRDTPDPNGALWASILPPGPAPSLADTSGKHQPWWQGDGRAPWMGLLVTGTLLLCLSLLGVARLLFAAPASENLSSATLTLAPELAVAATAPAPVETPAASANEPTPSPEALARAALPAPSPAPARVRYDEPERPLAVPAAKRVRTDQAQDERTAARRAQPKKRARSLARR